MRKGRPETICITITVAGMLLAGHRLHNAGKPPLRPDKPAVVVVVNRKTHEVREYASSPERAVAAAYAQERCDHDSQGQWERYGALVRRSSVSVWCGDWSCPTDPEDRPGQASERIATYLVDR